jgi:PIN domain nuclease of toxin-antitoxin system
MKLLLDTHALLWWWTNDAKLSAKAKKAIESERNQVLVSAASVWEIATKTRLGKLEIGTHALARFQEMTDADGFSHLPITWQHSVCAGSLSLDHRDPFDRMLAAQGLLEDATLVTVDPAFTTFATRVIW